MHHAPVATIARRRILRERDLGDSGSSFDKADVDMLGGGGADSSMCGGGGRAASALPAPHHKIHHRQGGGLGSVGMQAHYAAPAPSALKKPKYSSFPYARSDVGGRGAAGPRGLSDAYFENDTSKAVQAAGAASSGAEEEALCMPLLQPPGTVGAHGRILARTSPRLPLLGRKYKDGYWAHVYPTTLAAFRSAADFDRWREGGGPDSLCCEQVASGGGNKSGGGGKNVDKLVKWSVDFDTLGVVRKKEKKLRKERKHLEKEERRRLRKEKKDRKRKKKEHASGHKRHLHEHLKEQEDCRDEQHAMDVSDDDDDDSVGESTLLHGGESVADCSVTERASNKTTASKSGKSKSKSAASDAVPKSASHNRSVLKYSLLPVHLKPNKSGGSLHAFKLEKWTREGASSSAAFASSESSQVRALRSVIRELIASCERDHHRGGGVSAAPSGKGAPQSAVAGHSGGAQKPASSALQRAACGAGAHAQHSPTSESGTVTTSTPSSYDVSASSNNAWRSPAAATAGAHASSLEHQEGPVAGIKDPSSAARLHLSAARRDDDDVNDTGSSLSGGGGRARRKGPRFVHQERRRRAAANAASQ